MKVKQVLIAELPSIVVATGLGLLFWLFLDFQRGAMLFASVMLLLQPFVLFPIFAKRRSVKDSIKRSRPTDGSN